MKNKYSYFDIAATTPIDNQVIDLMHEINNNYFGNPSSVHAVGQKSHNLVEKSRIKIAEIINCKSSEIFFTSGGSESNNIVLKGLLAKGDHLITSSYEHPSILGLAKTLIKLIQPYDLIICLGAGSITKIANNLENELKNENEYIQI